MYLLKICSSYLQVSLYLERNGASWLTFITVLLKCSTETFTLDSCITMKDDMKEIEIQPVLPANFIFVSPVRVFVCLILIPEHGDDDCCS